MAVEVVTAPTIDEAQRQLGADRGARLFGGGTILMAMLNYGAPSVSKLVRCSDPELTEIRSDVGGIRIGAGITMNQVLAHRDLAVLAPVARSVGGPAVRAAATVGGNLFAAPPYGDFATALLALGATVHDSVGASTSIDDFLRERDQHTGRVVTAVSVPREINADALSFLKVTRVKPKGVALMTLAAHFPRRSGQINGLRVAYGNMGPVPVRAAAVERALEGASLDEAGIAPAISVACDGIEPPTDELASSWYRREVIPVHLKRLFLNRTR